MQIIILILLHLYKKNHIYIDIYCIMKGNILMFKYIYIYKFEMKVDSTTDFK